MVADLIRWSRRGGLPTKLWFMDASAGGRVWTDLANNPAGREACGWEPVGVPTQVAAPQLSAALAEAGLRSQLETWLYTQPAELGLAWSGDDVVRRQASWLLDAAAAFGWSDALLDDLFFAASAVP